jgi:hypothetical protein
MNHKGKNRLAVADAVEKARARADAMLEGKGRAAGVLAYFRSGVMADIPEGVTPADVKLAAKAALEENYAGAGFDPLRLPGLRIIGAAFNYGDIYQTIEYIIRLKTPAVDADAGAVRLRLGLAVTAI